MSLVLDLTPELDVRLERAARDSGIEPVELVKNVLSDHLPAQSSSAPAISEKNKRAIALLQKWREDGAITDADEERKAEGELQELMRNLNQNRLDAGERPMFP